MKRTEWRDGKLFTVTVLPPGGITKKRSHKTRYHFKDVGKAGDLTKPKPKPKPPEQKTKFPFAATINNERVIVWPDWVEHEETGEFI